MRQPFCYDTGIERPGKSVEKQIIIGQARNCAGYEAAGLLRINKRSDCGFDFCRESYMVWMDQVVSDGEIDIKLPGW